MTARKLNLATLTLAQLKQLQAEATELISAQERSGAAIAELVAQVRELAAARGVSIAQLAGALNRPAASARAVQAARVRAAQGATRAKPTVKYRKDGKSWTGRGFQPVWLKEHLAAGGKLEELAV